MRHPTFIMLTAALALSLAACTSASPATEPISAVVEGDSHPSAPPDTPAATDPGIPPEISNGADSATIPIDPLSSAETSPSWADSAEQSEPPEAHPLAPKQGGAGSDPFGSSVGSDGATVDTGPKATKSAKAVAEKSSRKKTIYLTFDDGPWHQYTDEILDILAKSNAKATFFVVGTMAKSWPKIIKRIAAEGHAIGNHTFGHADLTKLDRASIEKQLTDTADQVGSAMGPCLRPPYGQKNKFVVSVAKSLGYKTLMWTDSINDWNQPSVEKLVGDMKAVTKPKLNLLLHDGGGVRVNTVAAVRQMVPRWTKQGYSLKTLPDCRS